MEKPCKKKKKVAVAGHWNPLHVGHLQLIEAAKRHGDELVVIVANDVQAERKRPTFMPLHDRLMIMSMIKGVDMVVASIDIDTSIRNTLKMVKPDVLCSGCGPDNKDAIDEESVCKALGIKTLYNVGGEKIQSSSTIINKYFKK